MKGRRILSVLLLRNDLRLHDNPTLHAALKKKPTHLLPLYCVDPRQVDCSRLQTNASASSDGDATDDSHASERFKSPKTWVFGLPRTASLHKTQFLVETLTDLNNVLGHRGTNLTVRFGHPETIVPDLCRSFVDEYEVEVVWQKEQTTEELRVERALKKNLAAMGGRVRYTESDGATTLVHPDDLPFSVADCPQGYTEFRKVVEGLNDRMVRDELPTPDKLPPPPKGLEKFMSWQANTGERLRSLSPSLPGSPKDVESRTSIPFTGGETHALARLKQYLTRTGVERYKQTRNGLTGADYSTKFSIWLANGSLSARRIVHEIRCYEREHMTNGQGTKDTYWVTFELLWRDFWKFWVRATGSRVFRLHGGADTYAHGRPKDGYRWKQDLESFKRWRDGTTGIPFVDANMREIAATGYMSNRGRQNVASFLTKDLNIDWRLGAEYFESVLVDHDVCSNYGNWQYAAGVGVDPRDRKFNVVKQAKDYDPNGDFVRKWIPELNSVPDEHIHTPWAYRKNGVSQDGTAEYPQPMVVDRSWSRHAGRAPGHDSKFNKENPSENTHKWHRSKQHRQRF